MVVHTFQHLLPNFHHLQAQLQSVIALNQLCKQCPLFHPNFFFTDSHVYVGSLVGSLNFTSCINRPYKTGGNRSKTFLLNHLVPVSVLHFLTSFQQFFPHSLRAYIVGQNRQNLVGVGIGIGYARENTVSTQGIVQGYNGIAYRSQVQVKRVGHGNRLCIQRNGWQMKATLCLLLKLLLLYLLFHPQ